MICFLNSRMKKNREARYQKGLVLFVTKNGRIKVRLIDRTTGAKTEDEQWLPFSHVLSVKNWHGAQLRKFPFLREWRDRPATFAEIKSVATIGEDIDFELLQWLKPLVRHPIAETDLMKLTTRRHLRATERGEPLPTPRPIPRLGHLTNDCA